MNISGNLPVELENYDNLYWYFTTYIHESHTSRYQKELSPGEMGLNGNKEIIYSQDLQPDDKDKYFNVSVLLITPDQSGVPYYTWNMDRESL